MEGSRDFIDASCSYSVAKEMLKQLAQASTNETNLTCALIHKFPTSEMNIPYMTIPQWPLLLLPIHTSEKKMKAYQTYHPFPHLLPPTSGLPLLMVHLPFPINPMSPPQPSELIDLLYECSNTTCHHKHDQYHHHCWKKHQDGHRFLGISLSWYQDECHSSGEKSHSYENHPTAAESLMGVHAPMWGPLGVQ